MVPEQSSDKAESPWGRKYDAETIKLNGEPVEVIDVSPKHLRSPVPVLFAPGWSPDTAMLRQIMPAFVKAGRRGIAISAPHGIHVESGDPEMRKAEAVLELIKQKHLPKVNAIGYSEAGLYLIDAACREPEKFRSIVLVCPAGTLKKDSVPWLAGRLLKQMMIEMGDTFLGLFDGKHTPHSRLIRNIAKGTIPSFSPHSSREARALAERQIVDTLIALREKGVPVCIIQTSEDRVFPLERSVLPPTAYDKLFVMEGSHGLLYLKPEKIIPVALKMFEDMEKKEERH